MVETHWQRVRAWVHEACSFAKGRSRKQRFALLLCLLYMFMAGGWIGYVTGWSSGTGVSYFQPESQSVVPPDLRAQATSADVDRVFAGNPVAFDEYGEGSNCVELALEAARLWWWEGYQSTVVRIDFTDGTGHMVVGVPTTDAGWKFYNFSGGTEAGEIFPRVGGYLADKKIAAMFYLYDLVWRPIEFAGVPGAAS